MPARPAGVPRPLTALVNAHIQAVVPGVAVSVNTVLSEMERNPGKFIGDPWVAERATLVAKQRGRVVAAGQPLAGLAGDRGHPAGPGRRAARADRLLTYAWPEEHDLLGLLARLGFRELTRTARGWPHRAGPGRSPEANATPAPPPSARA